MLQRAVSPLWTNSPVLKITSQESLGFGEHLYSFVLSTAKSLNSNAVLIFIRSRNAADISCRATWSHSASSPQRLAGKLLHANAVAECSVFEKPTWNLALENLFKTFCSLAETTDNPLWNCCYQAELTLERFPRAGWTQRIPTTAASNDFTGLSYQWSYENIKMRVRKGDSVDLIYNIRFYVQREARI